MAADPRLVAHFASERWRAKYRETMRLAREWYESQQVQTAPGIWREITPGYEQFVEFK